MKCRAGSLVASSGMGAEGFWNGSVDRWESGLEDLAKSSGIRGKGQSTLNTPFYLFLSIPSST